MLTEGMFIADRYEIIGKIGTGGMSDVYKAKDLTLGRFVAIKVLKAEYSEDLNFVTKFRTEAQSAAGLEHPNIVNIYDVGSEKGMHYIVMECVEGITLKTYIEKKGQLSFKEAVSIAIQVGRGIEAAHNKGIIHRDIKPQNIIISTEGKVKVTDFGIARAATSNTIHSDVMGSVHYASPEQARNGFVDGKSDIYSLGIVMYEMVTGRVPFDGDTTVAVAIQHLQEEMVSPRAYAPNLPISMEKIILKCTQKNPDRRYESMSALLADLRKALVSPDEDFVVMVPVTNQGKTRVIKQEEVDQIKKETENIYLKTAISEEVEEETEQDEDAIDDEEEGELNPMVEKVITVIGIGIAVIIIVLIIVLLVNLFGGLKSGSKNSDTESNYTEASSDSQAEGDIEVPSLAGYTYEEAQELLNGLGLGIQQKGTVSSDEYDEGLIASQDTDAGTMVTEHTTIGVTLSSGKGSIAIQNVTGYKATDAIRTLEDAGFKVEKTYSYSSEVEEEYVISQTPVAGSMGKEGDTITLEISQGYEPVTVPDVYTTYKDEASAKALLSDFTVTVDTAYSEDYPEGIVMKQSLEPGTKAAKGSAITITISKGQDPSTIVSASTYKFVMTIKAPADTSNVSGATITLYDTAGNVLAQWADQPIDSFGSDGLKLSKTGLLVESGKVVITWLDLNGDKISDQNVDTVTFIKES
jgi:serine/threonine-protein kinase